MIYLCLNSKQQYETFLNKEYNLQVPITVIIFVTLSLFEK